MSFATSIVTLLRTAASATDPKTAYDSQMVVRFVIAVLWLTALGLMTAAMMLTKVIDIYVHDHYFVLPRLFVIGLILVVFIMPLLAMTLKRLKSAYR